MNNNTRQKFEENDLSRLHRWFEEGEAGTKADDLPYPAAPGRVSPDLWSETVSALSQCDEKRYPRLLASIKSSDFTKEEKAFWLSFLSSVMGAPLDELDGLARGNKKMPEQVSAASLLAVSRILAGYAAEKERERRRVARRKEKAKLDEISADVRDKQHKKQVAEDNLNRHRNQGQ